MEYTQQDLEAIAEYIREQQEAKKALRKVVERVATMPNKTGSIPFKALQKDCKTMMDYIDLVM